MSTDTLAQVLQQTSLFREVQKEEDYLLGIDEAGRGPILGPMTYAAAWCALKEKDRLAKLGFRDSKQLSPEKRERLFADLRENKVLPVSYEVKVIPASDISQQMQMKSKVNLNIISHNCAIDLIRKALTLGFQVKEVYVDTVGPKNTYQRKLQRLFPGIKITVSEKADDKYPIVSAASICAKVLRDKIMEHFSFDEEDITDKSYGSGYLADPKTKEWIPNNIDKVFGFPSIVRFSWTPSQQAMKKKLRRCKMV